MLSWFSVAYNSDTVCATSPDSLTANNLVPLETKEIGHHDQPQTPPPPKKKNRGLHESWYILLLRSWTLGPAPFQFACETENCHSISKWKKYLRLPCNNFTGLYYASSSGFHSETSASVLCLCVCVCDNKVFSLCPEEAYLSVAILEA